MVSFRSSAGRKATKGLVAVGVSLALVTVGFGIDRAVGTDGGGGATRTWVSGVGDDANPCSRTAPCKTWAGAFSKTAQPGGEIDALDPGGFGALTVTGGITINGGTGNTAGVLVAGTNGITVAAAAGDTVIIRNLDINGTNSGISGINFVSGKALYIENSTIENFTVDAVHVAPTAGGTVVLKNDVLRNNTGNGVFSNPGTSPVAMVVDGCTIQGNGGAGVYAKGNNVTNSTIVDIHNNTITGNFLGLQESNGGSINSLGGNVDDFNLVNGTPTTTKATV